MKNYPKYVDEPLFPPEQIQFAQLHTRVDLHYHGPENRLELWRSIAGPSGAWIVCEGGLTVPLSGDPLRTATEWLGEIHDATMGYLQPF